MTKTNAMVKDEIKVILRRAVGAGFIIDVNPVASKEFEDFDISPAFLQGVLNELQIENYKIFYLPSDRPINFKESSSLYDRVLAKPGTKFKEVQIRKEEILSISEARKLIDKKQKAPVIFPRPKRQRLNKKQIENLVFDIRQLKRKGMSNVAIAKEYNLNESTIRRHLKKPLTSKEKLIDTMLKAVESGQNHIVNEVLQTQEFRDVFGFDYGPGYYMAQKNDKIEVGFYTVDDSKEEVMTFNIRFSMKKVKDNR